MENELREVAFTVHAVPVSQKRQQQRVIKAKDGRVFATNYTPRDAPVQAFKAATALAASTFWKGAPSEGAIEIEVTFVMPRPKRLIWKRRPMPRIRHTQTPDYENLVKGWQDALSGLVWRDDRLISDAHLHKRIASGYEQPHVEVLIREVPIEIEEEELL